VKSVKTTETSMEAIVEPAESAASETSKATAMEAAEISTVNAPKPAGVEPSSSKMSSALR
jgi:hypothetical protein